ncbi:hypothetical protein B0H19DRAFT_1069255 [Mycena capillaripes]|nr:hypothetical protein B0H19DRAFT_1069255 [Mycena capillaripes]
MNLSKLRWPGSNRTNNYELLPMDGVRQPGKRRFARGLSFRSILYTLGVLVFLGVLYGVWTRRTPAQAQSVGIIATDDVDPPAPDIDPPPTAPQESRPPPPLYEEYRERERNLPQNNMSLPYPDGSHAKFLWAANHGSGFGWGNYMEEMIIDAYLAYAANRAYVFDNYTWDRDGPEISQWNGKPIPARIPLSALISGPIIGGFMPDKDVPRAVSREYFLSVCPEAERVVLDTRTIQETLDPEATVSQIVGRWAAELVAIESPCVELARSSPALFSYEITNTLRVLDVFPALSKSPILSNFGWSPLILAGFYANLKYFTASPQDSDGLPSLTETPTTPLNGLLALHVRRGDYETWCHDAYRNAMSYTGFNSFSELPDKYTHPPVDDAPESAEFARKHCLPNVAEIVDKVMAVAKPRITRVYVMTNAPREWLAELRAALGAAREWPDGVGTSRDLELSWEGKFVAEAVDMYVGQRAEQFIGNGVQAFTDERHERAQARIYLLGRTWDDVGTNSRRYHKMYV